MMFDMIQFHRDVIIPKSRMPRLPSGFQRTFLGSPRPGAISQYRGPKGLHVYEYKDYWNIHRDYADPRTPKGAILHLLIDAPEVLVAAIVGIHDGVKVYQKTKSLGKALLQGSVSAFTTWTYMKPIKE